MFSLELPDRCTSPVSKENREEHKVEVEVEVVVEVEVDTKGEEGEEEGKHEPSTANTTAGFNSFVCLLVIPAQLYVRASFSEQYCTDASEFFAFSLLPDRSL